MSLSPNIKPILMKYRLLLTAVFFVAVSVNSFAQKGPFLQIGLKAGTNITKVEGRSFNEEFKFGYTGGAFMQVRIGDKWHLQPEIQFNQFKTKTAYNFDEVYAGGYNLKDVKLNYLTIPLLLDYSSVKFFTLQGGVQYGKLLDRESSLLETGKEAFKSGDFSLLGGVQLNIAAFKINGRYILGLTNINDIDNREKWKNQGFQVTVGFRIVG
jgi:hypothetical protein